MNWVLEAQKTVLLSETGKPISDLGALTVNLSSELEKSCVPWRYSLPAIPCFVLVL